MTSTYIFAPIANHLLNTQNSPIHFNLHIRPVTAVNPLRWWRFRGTGLHGDKVSTDGQTGYTVRDFYASVPPLNGLVPQMRLSPTACFSKF